MLCKREEIKRHEKKSKHNKVKYGELMKMAGRILVL
jgi:hypothetical protein